MELKYTKIDSGTNPQHAIIMLHGLGANSADFAFLPTTLKLSRPVRYIFPDAPVRHITINNGYQMQAWYDILDISSLSRKVDFAGILQSVTQIESIITQLLQDGFEASNILIAGFSQGGVISYYTFFNSKYSLAGSLILSSYLPQPEDINQDNLRIRQTKPIMVMHGNQDPVVSYQYGKSAYDFLLASGCTNVSFKSYPMAHQVLPEQLVAVSQYINDVFGHI